jgi:hypothetical protein
MPAQVRLQMFPALTEVRLPHQQRHRYYGEYLRFTPYDIIPFPLLPALENLLIGTHMTCIRGSCPGGDYNGWHGLFVHESPLLVVCIEGFGEALLLIFLT